MNKKGLKIAISKNDKIFKHSGSWSNPWIEHCEKNKINFEVIDCYQPNIISTLSKFDCLLWHVNNYVLQDMMIGRSILYTAKNMGLITFPDYHTSWHFDDKISETYLLQGVDAPIPNSWMFYSIHDCDQWLRKDAPYPLIAKLRSGSGSNNVKLLKNQNQALRYSRRMFSAGFKTYPNVIFKTKSQLLSSPNWDTIKARMKRIPEFFHTLSRAKMFPKEKGYVYFQEFIPNDGFDLKIVVIGDKLSYICRHIRKNDFRASGGGDIFFERNLISRNIIYSAFSISDRLGFQCMGYDYIVDRRTGMGKIVEISYGFSHEALLKAGGYFDRDANWHEEPLNAPAEVIDNLIRKI